MNPKTLLKVKLPRTNSWRYVTEVLQNDLRVSIYSTRAVCGSKLNEVAEKFKDFDFDVESAETDFAAIDEAIATHRSAMPVDPDHGPMGNPEAEMAYEIKLLRAENERLKIKLSRMCGDA